jgi:hypothetical protein
VIQKICYTIKGAFADIGDTLYSNYRRIQPIVIISFFITGSIRYIAPPLHHRYFYIGRVGEYGNCIGFFLQKTKNETKTK